MNNLIDKTRRIGIEYGAIIEGDLDKGILNTGIECTGTECTVELIRKPKKEFIEEFHTHPSGSAKPSPADLRRFESIGNIICVGAPQDSQNKINCYHRKFTVFGPELAKRRTEILDEIIRDIETKKVFTKDDRRRRDMILEMDFDEFSPDDCKLDK